MIFIIHPGTVTIAAPEQHAYTHVYTHANAHVGTHVRTHARTLACTHVYTHVCTHACTHAYIHVYAHVCLRHRAPRYGVCACVLGTRLEQRLVTEAYELLQLQHMSYCSVSTIAY